MKYFKKPFEHTLVVRNLLKWAVLAIPVSTITGSFVALFLYLLDVATQYRWQHPWLLFLLPIAGICIHFLYKLYGKNADKGNNLIIDEIHEPGGGVPARMAPFVLVATVITHLFGGSAGREGTAVQIGGSMANFIGKQLRLSKADIRILLMMGIAAGFGAVFGTPVAGAVFAVEVLIVGKIKYDALVPCLIAAVFADMVCSAWGIRHTHYTISFTGSVPAYLSFLHFDFLLFLKVIIAGVVFGLSGYLFANVSHQLKALAVKYISVPWFIPAVGGVAIIGLTYLSGTTDYLGLGVVSEHANGISIVNAFHEGGVTTWSWLWKLVFTVVTLSLGFKGGEVTPLFFIGAALGNTIAIILGAPVDLFAGLGFIAVFAGATNTPIACTLMGIELFGGDNVIYFAVACFTAYYCSGRSGIYSAQRFPANNVKQ